MTIADATREPADARPALAGLRRTVLMLLPGSAGIIATVGLATGRIGDLSAGDANRFLVFLQVELLALGIGRIGFDQLVLSRASALDDPDRLAFVTTLVRRVLPFAVGVSAIAAVGLGGRAGVAVIIAAPLDMVSTVTGSFELARRRYATNMAFSWMNFPVFLAALTVPGIRVDSTRLTPVLAVFCATSTVRAAVAVTLLARHLRRHRIATGSAAPETLSSADLSGAGIATAVQVMLQRGDGMVLALADGRFAPAAVSSYLLAGRLVDASYTVSAVVGSLRQVRSDGPTAANHEGSGLARAAGWLGLWLGAAVVLALLQWPDVGTGWGRLLLAALAAAAYLAIFRHVLLELGQGHGPALARRFGAYVAVLIMAAAAAVLTREPALLFTASIACGLASAYWIRTYAAER